MCVFVFSLKLNIQMRMLLFSPELGLPAGALCMYPEEAGVRWSVSEAQPGAAQPPAPHTA